MKTQFKYNYLTKLLDLAPYCEAESKLFVGFIARRFDRLKETIAEVKKEIRDGKSNRSRPLPLP